MIKFFSSFIFASFLYAMAYLVSAVMHLDTTGTYAFLTAMILIEDRL
jgi:hypothetical protein